jgi:hypothetical protein
LGSIEFVFENITYQVRREVLPDRVLHHLYYKQHLVGAWKTDGPVSDQNVVSHFQDWLAGRHAGPYECRGGPLDGEQLRDRGDAFKVAAEAGRRDLEGEYRRSGMLYIWEQPPG